ncbi:MAG: acyl-CoA dehydrogenase family protein [Parvularculaceae bacterium]
MSDNRKLLLDMGERLFADLREQREVEDVWPVLREAGLQHLFRPESADGFGGDWGDGVALLHLSGLYPVNAPLAEILAATWLEETAGFARSDEIAVLAGSAHGKLDGGRFTGEVMAVPVAEGVSRVIAAADGSLVRLDLAAAAKTAEGRNLAGDKHLRLTFESVPAEAKATGEDAIAWGALARTAQIAGALDGVLKLSIDYANERQQFGRPIAKFQSVQQSLALLAEEAAAANCVAQAAAQAADHGDATLECACAKLRAGKAAAIGVEIGHQVHGAIGFTKEHALHDYTRRLAAWRSEFGNERYWGARIGKWAAERGGEALWSGLAERSDRIGKAS